MTRKHYPNLLFDTLHEICEWIKFVSRERDNDIKDLDKLKLEIEQLPQCFLISCGDETTAAAAANGVITFRMPFAFTLTSTKLTVTTAPTGVTKMAVDINAAGVSIFSTVMTLDTGEKTTATASVPAVLTTFDLAADAEITIDIDAVGSTIAGAGVKVYLIGYNT